jgi:hypothetical protein
VSRFPEPCFLDRFAPVVLRERVAPVAFFAPVPGFLVVAMRSSAGESSKNRSETAAKAVPRGKLLAAGFRMPNEINCDHRGCRCEDAPVERGNERYCSERCADMEMSATPDPLCQCGHADCAA